MRTLLIASGLDDSFWAEAMNYAVYTRNKSPCGPDQRVPDDLWGFPARNDHLQPFGVRAYYREGRQQHKLQPRYRAGIFVGYEHDTHNYRIWDTQLSQFRVSRDVVFSKTVVLPRRTYVPSVSDLVCLTDSDDEAVDRAGTSLVDDDFSTLVPLQVVSDAPPPAAPVTPLPSTPSSTYAVPSPDAPGGPDFLRGVTLGRGRAAGHDIAAAMDLPQLGNTPSVSDADSRGATPLGTASASDAGSDDPLNIIDQTTDHDSSASGGDAFAFLVHGVALNYRQARRSSEWEHWDTAMDVEWAKLLKYDTFELADRPPHVRALATKWVCTMKYDSVLGKEKYNARLVVLGNRQPDDTYGELFASVAHKDSLRAFVGIVNKLDLECDQVDIKAAFLNGDLQETIYLLPPQGMEHRVPKGKFLRLKKTLYGLRQSPRCFNKTLDKWLQEQGLQPNSADPCLYNRVDSNGHRLMLIVHVDDQLIACDDRATLDQFKRDLNARFECSDAGPARHFLGFDIIRGREARTIGIRQDKYLRTVLERFNMEDCSARSTPLPPGFIAAAATDEEHAAAKDLPYASLVGSINYPATISRPDLAHAASVLSAHLSKWSITHWEAAKHVLRYIKGTLQHTLHFDAKDSDVDDVIYVDADWAGEQDKRSNTGFVVFTHGGPVSWKSRRQKTVAKSALEAEYMAGSDGSDQVLWLQRLHEDLGLPLPTPFHMRGDNAGMISFSRNPDHFSKAKHIDIRFHSLRERVQQLQIELSHVRSQDNIADFLTKSLAKDKFEGFIRLLRLSPAWSSGSSSRVV